MSETEQLPPTDMMRDLLDMVDPTIEATIEAHGFNFAALSADENGAQLRVEQFADEAGVLWQLTLSLSHLGQPDLSLRRGGEGESSVLLLLRIDGHSADRLSGALATAMTLFSAVPRL